jgi:hypothetical protein
MLSIVAIHWQWEQLVKDLTCTVRNVVPGAHITRLETTISSGYNHLQGKLLKWVDFQQDAIVQHKKLFLSNNVQQISRRDTQSRQMQQPLISCLPLKIFESVLSVFTGKFPYYGSILSIYLWLCSPFLDLGRFFSFLILYIVDRNPLTGDQPIARPLSTHRTTQTQNKHIQTSMPWVGFEPMIPAFERAKWVNALDSAATAIGGRILHQI